ncbi:ice-binding family protein [Legionella bononiensis]|uniref:DUF3494 domain-containing protein n=1 Tax=Legionella bononiensis TaxID=2793102 RepID=A0ABS1WGA9_9GAMM|nr:ice-binding family protein [Legionella bononiensis]MBL7528315.1 DUF3494 domain-containing protein [Legionella bononiensis]MBL7562789.1 DUF3494 domain-containing protein [Legionella bononiensis]
MLKKIQHGSVILSLLFPLATHALSCSGLLEDDTNGFLDENTYMAICDGAFINPPSFGPLCINATSIGTYTLRNNAPVPFRINYIRIQSNDALPAAASIIIPAVTNNCGSSLAAGATCNISVQLLPLGAGVFNRVLQVGINTRQVQVDAPAITTVVGNCAIPGPIPPPPGFQPTIPATPSFLFQSSILGATTVTNTGGTLVSGDLDLTPGSSVTGFPPGTIVNGTLNINNTAASNTKTAASNYFNALNSLPCSVIFGAATDISALLQPINCVNTPVLCFSSSALMTGPVQIFGPAGSSCTFRIASTLTVSNNATMTTAGGIFNDNINWAIGSSATLGTNSTLYGIIDAYASITLQTNAVLKGRAWALNGAVTLDTNQVNPAAP